MREHEVRVESPVGPLRIVAAGGALVRLDLEDGAPAARFVAPRRSDDPVLAAACDQLAGWFAGERVEFELPLAPAGTPFQAAVWRALLAIPFGETRTYAEIAAQVGQGSPRAVGAANGRNPIAIVVPCHRVIGSGGALVGYAGGLARKRGLLDHERVVTMRRAAQAR